MFLIFLKILVPFLFKETPKLRVFAINLRKPRSIEHFKTIFSLRILPSLSKLLKRQLGSEFFRQMKEVNLENLGVEVLIGDDYANNSQKNKNIVKTST